MVEECCESVENQCDCFFRFGQAGTPFHGICEAVLLQDYSEEAGKPCT